MTRRRRWRVERCRNGHVPSWTAYQPDPTQPGVWVPMDQHFPTWDEAMAHAHANARHEEPPC